MDQKKKPDTVKKRRCERCNCILRSTNTNQYCDPCQRIINLEEFGLTQKAYLTDTEFGY